MSTSASQTTKSEKDTHRVVGPDGKLLDSWMICRRQRPNAGWRGAKAEVVAAVRAQLLTLEEACKRYNLSTEEFVQLGSGDRQAWAWRPPRHAYSGL